VELYNYKATVLKVIDGDTFKARVDVGFDVTTVQKFRMLGINAPEMKGESKKAGEVSKEWLREAIEGQEVTVNSQGKDAFGRWLCVVYLNGVSINRAMIEVTITRFDGHEEWLVQ